MNAQISTRKTPIWIALGSNMGDRAANLRSAIQQMAPAVTVLAESRIYQTAPWGYADQPDFLNQVFLGETDYLPVPLLVYLKEIEERVGRTPTFRNGPRLLDLDILFYADRIINQPGLQIPHPRMHERVFVLVPLNDLNPDLQHPVTHQTVHEMLSQLDDQGISPFCP